MAMRKSLTPFKSQIAYRLQDFEAGDHAESSDGNKCRQCCGLPRALERDGGHNRDHFSPKDATKRKRVNRVAKLKQCKLDARREQWLSQGCCCQRKQGEGQCSSKDEKRVASGGNNVSTATSLEQCNDAPSRDSFVNYFAKERTVKREYDGSNFSENHRIHGCFDGQLDFNSVTETSISGRPDNSDRCTLDEVDKTPLQDSHVAQTLVCSTRSSYKELRDEFTAHDVCCGPSSTIHTEICPTKGKQTDTKITGKVRSEDPKSFGEDDEVQGAGRNKQSSASMPGCFANQLHCSSGPCSSTYSDSDEISKVAKTKDDWEVAADALYDVPLLGMAVKEVGANCRAELKSVLHDCRTTTDGRGPDTLPQDRSKADRPSTVGGRAWRSDDAFRPPTLPTLFKTVGGSSETSSSNAFQGRNLWGPPPLPSYCPICTEELDITDSSFCPCSCDFRLCLFCYHRIFSDDGRCPGCRKNYSPDAAVKLSRTTWLRV